MGWKRTDEAAPLDPGMVAVWRIKHDESDFPLEETIPLLSCLEKERHDAFKFAGDRNAYRIGQAGLRILAGRYLGVKPGSVEFMTNEYGKPWVRLSPPTQRLSFNLSNSGSWTVIAFCMNTEVGVDVEQIKRFPEALVIASQYFSPREVTWLSSQPDQDRAFCRLWTRKEAVIKAEGGGLALPLNSFSVLEDEVLFKSASGIRTWYLSTSDVDVEHCAALATGTCPGRIDRYELSGTVFR